ncbi:LOW QUALITY PROTEIN: AP-3 complex subunit delta [Colletotrichum higginsianum IMI 349063]|uniref:AP-3 complex subunit delta n=1 Tax=Colletotrichum higginsianum (strain IMI 349063) TaxID=759273 RepID=A0A1B7YJ46_COLHI|nr:LOW QUALITY PROTEIN: AP-3 complex subunit delta [Colletotrichum higginsianum IMI 349063]OBR12097.1 LOW QUALITY PROTEIN: AP-3 complex subunit delta [Colletotrichum higginsianum IMI 349063]
MTAQMTGGYHGGYEDEVHALTCYTMRARFEKSLYDLIRGLRNHKGNEREYIQNSLKECRAEVRGQDMDVKATALLKLVYLEMVGHDMSWASFHVLEVMSSQKYHQKRVGYLAAVQSFRPDTEVLMLATNLLKKDLSSTQATTISLPMSTLPHIITPSLALSTLSDLLPRLGHSNPAIRKKTIVTLYRLALVYPETLRAAWPKIKERLMDKDEDPSVTAAIVNVVCELGWRRPHDFLPLAPRLFELLVDGGNNWMAIKLIKLFATLTPLEPRLVRKLLPPLTELIRTTPAMSLLYECINGIIQGGILGSADDISGREEIATLCVNKLRGMIMVDGDPNLKYVALLAFNKIVVTHPFLVAQQEDVILECIDSPDITIRIKALDLGMVSSDNLVSIVGRLMKQLKSSTPKRDRPGAPLGPDTGMDSDEEAEIEIHSPSKEQEEPPLPDDYRSDVIGRILTMCSQNNYSSLVDFDWYIDVLIQLVRMAPIPRSVETELDSVAASGKSTAGDVSGRIGDELRNVAVKVHALRGAAVRAADLIIQQMNTDTPTGHALSSASLKSTSWLVGEYATQLAFPEDTLGNLLRILSRTQIPDILTTSLQGVTKIFAYIAGNEDQPWTPEWKTKITLLLARIIHTLEPLALHPNLEVQERSVEFIELLKLTAEAASGQASSSDETHQDPPLLLTQAIPSLFQGWELNSVALGAQRNVPMPEGLDLDEPIHPNLAHLLARADIIPMEATEGDDFEVYYHQRPAPTSISSAEPAINRIADAPAEEVVSSYQQATEDSYLDADIVARRKAERNERNRDDPFYIGAPVPAPRTSTPIHNILQKENGPDLDIDSIPIMQLDLDKLGSSAPGPASPIHRPQPRPKQRVVIAADETLVGSGVSTPRNYESENNSDSFTKSRAKKLRQGLLQVDSSTLGSLSLEDDAGSSNAPFDYERQQREEAEMARAMKEVERLRLEMQRANERIQVAQGVDVAGTVVKKKTKKSKDKDGAEAVKTKKKKKKAAPAEVAPPAVLMTEEAENSDGAEDRALIPPPESAIEGQGGGVENAGPAVVVPKKKKKKKTTKMAEIAGDSG